MEGDLHGDDLVLLLVDGDNLLHAVRGGRDDGGVAWLLPRLSRWRPAGTRVVVALDGHPAHGESSRRRVATGIEFHHAGTRTADDLIVDLLASQPFAARARCVVVTRDVDLHRARPPGGRADPIGGLARQPAGRAEARQAVRAARTSARARRLAVRAPATGQDEERPPWRPGRGATRKRGNPRRGAKAPRQR